MLALAHTRNICEFIHTGQGNNAYIFPGVGLGVIAAGATRVSDTDMLIAAKTLADCVTSERLTTGCLYPNLDDIREVSLKIACAIANRAWDIGTATVPRPDDVESICRSHMYIPEY